MPDALWRWIYLQDGSMRKKLSSVGRVMCQARTDCHDQIACGEGLARGRMGETTGNPEVTWIAVEQPTHGKRGRQQAVASFRQLFAERLGARRPGAATRDNDDSAA
jgi:hypothetical protein